MLNARQVRMMLEMYEAGSTYFTASYFSKKHAVSVRTTQADMKSVKEELEQTGLARVVSQQGRGSYLAVEDAEMFSDWVNNLYMQHTVGSLSYPLSRVTKIVFILLGRFREMPMYELEETLFISRSTLLTDLRSVQKSLAPFRLSVQRKDNRLRIVGSEIDKRRCLAENGLYLAHLQGIEEERDNHIDLQRISYLKDVLLNVFVEFHYYIQDADFSNAVLTLNIMLHRAQKRFFIQEKELRITDDIEKELRISERIFAKLSDRFLCRFPREEVRFFAIYLKGQEIFKNHDIISKELDEFIRDAFLRIKANYGVDFTNSISLRIAIALHCIPLMIRVKYDMQLQSASLTEVRETFPLGYEIATYFSYLLREAYLDDARIIDDEIALIAAHFYGTLLELRQKKKETRVLVISSLKMSMTVLLRSILMKWFSREIAALDFIHADELHPSMLDDYDVFLTTEKNEVYDNGLAMYITPFPTELDRRSIKLLLDGFSDIEDVVGIFSKDLFFYREHATKAEILELLSAHAEEHYGLSGILDAVLERENIGSTFFSRGIALPHPMQAVSSDTFVSTCVIRNPVCWDEEGSEVQIVMLIHIGKNNPRSFQLWDYFSHIFEEKKFAEEIAAEPTFERFTQRLKELLTERFVK